MLIGHPRVTIAPGDGPEALGEAIIRRQRAAAAQMEPDRQPGAQSTAEASFLVSRDFYDFGDSWATPASREARSNAENSAEPPSDFHPTRAARALIAVYQRLLDES
jgi:lysophospholipase L1-like esterase